MIRLSKSVIGQEELDAVCEVLKREYLGMGEDVKSFEEDLTSFFGRPALCVNTGTAAIQLALQAIGIKLGDEVLVQSLTFLATFQAISASGAKPVPCEIEENTFTIDLKDAETRITPKTKAIMPVHYAGCPGDLKSIYQFAEKYKLRVIEDAAHAFGTKYKNKLLGGFGDISCFSFDGIKNITSGEGGAVVTNDKNVIKKISDIRLLGVQNDTEKRFVGKRSWDFDVNEQGWRYHMSNIMAAIGRIQLKKFPFFKEKRQQFAKLYQQLLKNNEGIKLLDHDYDQVVPHIFVIRVDNKEKIIAKLNEFSIPIGIHYKPNHLLSYYNPGRIFSLPNTEKIYSEIISLPLHPDLTEDKVRFICKKLLLIIGQ